VDETVVSGRKRLQLIGKPLPLSGLLLDGQPLDVAALQGKIVLIDFWATWCDPCLAEIPNIKACYEKYHDKGFEVIGYNLDKDRADVDRFFANQKLPWPTVVSDAKGKDGFTSPLAEFCGVKSIPFLVLLDGEGKVIALHTRGERLEKKLAELFEAPAK
ncbi:MAG TPA: TlpA disulfide reductase family protein, partial [Pirellulaceae bacterium]|nr:TlpA disulfide reductase family protein [Pirellulaceae bacterium]